MNIPVKSGTWIPAGRFRQVFQTYSQRVLLARLQIFRDIEVEGVVTIRPITDLLSIDIDIGMAHRPVKQDRCPLACLKLRNVELGAIPTHTDKRQPAGTSCMLHRFLLAVLRDSDLLFVVQGTERAVDRPIMGDSHGLPLTVIESWLYKLIVVFAGELPVFFQQKLTPSLCRQCRHAPKQAYQSCKIDSFHSY